MTTRATLLFLVGSMLVPCLKAQAPLEPRLDALGDPLPDGTIARIGTTRLKHEPARGTTIDVALFSPDGTKVVSLDNGSSIRLWDTASGKEIPGPWRTANQGFTAVAFSPDGTLLAAATNRVPRRGFQMQVARKTLPGEIIIYDIANLQVVKTLKGVAHYTRALAFADECKTLVSAGEGSVIWWDMATGGEKRKWQAFPDENQPVEGGTKSKTFFHCVLAPDLKTIAVQAAWQLKLKQPIQQRFEQFEQHEAMGFDLATGKITWRVAANGQRGDISRLTFSADGKRVAIGLEERKVEVRDTVTGKLIIPPLDAKLTGGYGGLALSADGRRLAFMTGDANVLLWNLDDPETAVKFLARKGRFLSISAQRLQFSPDNRTLLLAMDAGLQIYDVESLREVHAWEGHHASIDYLAFSSDGKRLMTASGTGNMRSEESITWDSATWKRWQPSSSASPRWPNLTVASPDQSVYAGKSDDGRLALYNMMNGKLLARLTVPSTQPAQTRGFFSPSGKLFVLDSSDDRGKNIKRLYAVPSGKALCQLPELDRNQMAPSSAPSMAFSTDERLVALLGQDNHMIHLCETATGKVRHRLGKEMPQDGRMFFGRESAAMLAFSWDGMLLASSTGAYDPETNTLDTSVHIWDVATGKQLLQVETDVANLPGRPFFGDRVPFAWSPDNRTLAVGQNKIRVWEIRTQGVRRELAGHTDALIRALAFSPDGRVLASGSADTTVLIWDATDRNNPTSAPREPRELEKRWRALAEDDAAKAYAAIRDLAAAPEESVSWIKERVKPTDAIDPKHIDDLISQLDNEQFKVRQKTSADLLHIGERAIAALDKALAGTPTLETSRRLQDLRRRAAGLILKGERLQAFRAVEVLERIGTPKAREVLQILADGATGAQVTTQAREALARLGN